MKNQVFPNWKEFSRGGAEKFKALRGLNLCGIPNPDKPEQKPWNREGAKVARKS